MKQESIAQELRQELEQIKAEIEKFAMWVGIAVGFLASFLFMALWNKA